MKPPSVVPAKTLEDAIRACNPYEPLHESDLRWQDFSSVRGPHIQQRIFLPLETARRTGDFARIVLAGHRGSGKSTELYRVKERAQRSGFFVIDTRMDEQLAAEDTDYSDFLLVVTRLLEARLRENGIRLPQRTIDHIAKWYYEVTQIQDEEIKASLGIESEAKVGAEIPFLGKIMTALTSAVKSSETRRTEIRNRVQKYSEQLVGYINLLLDDAHKMLGERGQTLLFIFDNVDRLEPEQAYNVLVKSGDKLARIQAHMILTVPIALLYDPRERISELFKQETLPMIPILNRGGDPNDQAIKLMLAALEKRISIPDIFTDPALAHQVVLRSGGCLRDMLRLLTETLPETTSGKIDRASLERGSQIVRSQFVRQIQSDDYPRLAECHLDNKIKNDEAHRRLLFQRAILEYDTEAWWEVHPLITQIREFQDEFNRLCRERGLAPTT